MLAEPLAVVNPLRLALFVAKIGQQDGTVAHDALVGGKHHIGHVGLLVDNFYLDFKRAQDVGQLAPLRQSLGRVDGVGLHVRVNHIFHREMGRPAEQDPFNRLSRFHLATPWL